MGWRLDNPVFPCTNSWHGMPRSRHRPIDPSLTSFRDHQWKRLKVTIGFLLDLDPDVQVLYSEAIAPCNIFNPLICVKPRQLRMQRSSAEVPMQTEVGCTA